MKSGGCVCTVRKDFLHSGSLPGSVVRSGFVKCGDFVRINALLPASVRDRAKRGDTLLYYIFEGIVISAFFSDYTITVVWGFLEYGYTVADIGYGNRVLFQSEIFEYPLRAGENLRAFGSFVIDCRKREYPNSSVSV